MKKINNQSFFKKLLFEYFGGVILYTILIVPIFIYNFETLIATYSDTLKNTIEKSIIEYNEIDLQHLCAISECSEIGLLKGSESFIPGKTHLIKNSNKKIFEYLFKNNYPNYSANDSFINTGFNNKLNDNTLILIPNHNLYVLSNTSIIFFTIEKMYLYIYLILLCILSIVFLLYKNKINTQKELEVMNSSNILREKNMQILTENIHHELNTPVAIIQGGILKVESILKNSAAKANQCNTNCSLAKMNDNVDFGLIYSSIDQINTVLERMSNFKHLRYSNGDKNLKDILSYSANSMSIYKAAHFKIMIDDDFENWGLKHGNNFLRNEDLLNIISNHFRNSIEATSTKIEAQLKITQTSENNILAHIFIIDNGNGLRDKNTGLLLPPSKYQNIFKDYYSSKNKQGVSKVRQSKGKLFDMWITLKSSFIKEEKTMEVDDNRGVGLYLNTSLLLDSGGELKLRETSEKGTVFEIIVPVIKFHHS